MIQALTMIWQELYGKSTCKTARSSCESNTIQNSPRLLMLLSREVGSNPCGDDNVLFDLDSYLQLIILAQLWTGSWCFVQSNRTCS